MADQRPSETVTDTGRLSHLMNPDLKTDVLVVGAGAAGVAAAISAARAGAKTLLIEGAGFLGGVSATLPWLGFHDRDYRQVVKGLAAEFVSRLQQAGHSSGLVLDPKCGSLASVDSHHWKCLAMQLAREAGVNVLLHTQAIDTLRSGSRIDGVLVHHKSGLQHLRADVTIDTSGDGDVAARGGVAWEKGRSGDGLVQAPTLVFRLGGVSRGRFVAACKDRSFNYREWFQEFPELYDKLTAQLDSLPAFVLGGFAGLIATAREAGDFELPQTRIVGVKTHPEDELTVVMTRVLGLDPVDVNSVSSAYGRIYEQIPELVRFFQRYVPGCRNARLLEIAPMLGVRESRRIMGDYVLGADEMIAGARHADAVAMGGYHIDIHRPKGTWVESRNVKAYTIPLRSLIARDVTGLLMAGKCISATHEAIAGTRVIPICMAQGQAAGLAAAMAVERGCDVRDLETEALQRRLADAGAEFGPTLGPPDRVAIERFGQLPMIEPPTEGDCDPVSARADVWV